VADAAADREFFAKSGRTAMPPLTGEALFRFTNLTSQPQPDDDSRCLSVGRRITLSAAFTFCDKLFIKGSVEANLTSLSLLFAPQSRQRPACLTPSTKYLSQ
jgi:hypothetical protein